MIQSMDGQWIGRVEGDAPGIGVFELDDFGTDLKGIAYHFPDDPQLPGVTVRFTLPNRGPKHSIKGAPLTPINPANGFVLQAGEVQHQFPDSVVGATADLEIEFRDNGHVQIAYLTPISKGEGTLIGSLAGTGSKLVPHPDVTSWSTFKEWAFEVEPHRYFYRGQSVPKRLRTSFHRTNRKNLAWYRDWDINEMRRVLSAQLKHFFDPRDPDQNGAFYNLLQHHGYPTPLLDWSLSPFVAAYFAFCAKPGDRKPEDVVRIYIFDAKHWREDVTPQVSIAYVAPHFSIIDLHAIENHRMIPQQAKATLTNIDDIETFVVGVGDVKKKEYLMAVDLPLSERGQALSDLNLMGINAGSLFPGIDGTCEAMRYRNFEP
ncbi:FRG domain-containing protein [Caulobacter sp. RHG1]|uniref:FRG domain-containing protein n=1 Tax=Caulobacter sp. (strain RHG1) TaxID=2545762 RepID=UPI0015563364|nr:FRG domain-containing protein [Caulobacter sp. RHG1]NQE64531.1 hypothetical protein [Caulobacter sp. RHG1]